MNLRLFLDSVHDWVQTFPHEPDSLGAVIFHDFDQLPKWKDLDLALIGADEHSNGANVVRQHLYALRRSRDHYRVVDLGNLRPGTDREQSLLRLREVCEYLLGQNVVPIILADSHELDFAQYLAHGALSPLVTVAQVDCRPDLDSHLQRILAHQPNYLLSLSLIGYQQYLTSHEALATLQKIGADLMSVGKLRDDYREAEPLLRAANLLSLDLAAVRRADAPANRALHPFGLTGEEACQLCWYAGAGEHLTSCGLYGYDAAADPYGQTAALVAVMVWYFLEGYYHRVAIEPFTEVNFIKYRVPMGPSELVFFKHKTAEKWWLDIPLSPAQQEAYGPHLRVPCSYRDFEQATSGHLPDRWVRAVERVGE
jgi:formiminoglutamase